MESLARVLVGLIAVALLIQLVQHGWAGVGDWLRAKFLGAAVPRRP